jgi:hypothetical protein
VDWIAGAFFEVNISVRTRQHRMSPPALPVDR